MLKRILCYWLAVLVTLGCFFIYSDEILRILLVIECLYFCISVVSLAILYKGVKASLISRSLIAEKNEEISISILVQNLSYISTVHFDVILRIENTFTGEKIKHRAHGKVDRKKEKMMMVSLCIKECGNMKITLERIEIYDRFCILKIGKKIGGVSRIGILPECHLIPVEISRKTREFIADADEYSERESGDDSSEIYQVREYKREDSIHDIHWKLSAKADELLVKEYGKPLGAAVLIWLDLEKSRKTRTLRRNFGKSRLRKETEQKEMLAKLFEIVASLSISLLEEKCVHMVAWYEQGNKVIHKKKISKEEHIYELLHRLLYVENYENVKEVETQYEEAFRGVDFSTIIKLQMDGKVVVQEEEISVPIHKGDIKWEQFYLKV